MESESTEVSETNDVQTLGIRIIKSSGEPFTGMWIHFKLMEDAGIATIWLVRDSFSTQNTNLFILLLSVRVE